MLLYRVQRKGSFTTQFSFLGWFELLGVCIIVPLEERLHTNLSSFNAGGSSRAKITREGNRGERVTRILPQRKEKKVDQC